MRKRLRLRKSSAASARAHDAADATIVSHSTKIAGHWLLEERPKETIEALQKFL